MTERPYIDPSALRQAITDRLRQLVRQRPGAQLADLHRQFAYDRLLSRVFVAEPMAWVVKGATALLARLGGSARHTVDVDLYRRDAGLAEAEVARLAGVRLVLLRHRPAIEARHRWIRDERGLSRASCSTFSTGRSVGAARARRHRAASPSVSLLA